MAHYAGLALLGGLSLAAAESLAIPLPANFVIRGNLEFSGRTASPAHLEFQTGSNCIVRISLARDQVILEAEQPPQKTHLGAARLASPRPKKCTFTVCRDGEALAFLSPGYATGRWRLPGPEAPETLPTPEVGTRPAEEETWNLIVREGAGVRIADLRLQPTTPVEFSDDFMRSDEGSGTWNPLRGLWALDEIPYPTWSASPFRLKGTGPGVALTTSGFWFWHDYAMRCAVRPGGDSLGCGIALYAQGPSDMILFRWKRRNPREEDEPRHVQGALELLLVHDGEERLLASQEAWLDPSQWYELAAGVCEGQVCAFVDGIRLFQVSCPEATLGGIGLWALDGALFDDVEAKSFSPGLLAAPKNDPDEFLERLFGHRRVVVGERFARDALMQEWANAQGEWVSRPDPRGQLLWHIGLFGPRVRLRWDCSWKPGAIPDPVLWAMTTDGRDLSSGYLLRLGPETLLLRGDRTLGRGTLPAQIESLEWTRQDGRHTLRANGQTVLSAEDAEPAGAGKVGLLLPGTSGLILDAGRLTADSPACHDTTFGTAPVDWRAAAGVWDITSRWICTPKWSWFGGLSHEAAVIWSKRAFLGDQVIDLHSAVMMDFGAAGGYRRLGDINLSFCADGASLGSGYTLMYGGFNNTRTCLWRQGEVVAERSDRLYPDKSRGAHKNWYNLRAEKMGPSVRFYLADELILEYRDPQPLPGGHVALWTWDGGMMIPRVRIYAESEMTPPRETLFAAPDASPGSADEYRSREARIRDETGRACLRFVNPQSGGDFSSALPIGEFDALKTGVLSFDYRIPAEARLHLYLEANGRDFYVALNGPETPSEHAIRQATEVSGRRINVSALTGRVRRPARLASLPISADDCWHHAEIELADLLRPFFPRASAIRVRGVHLANWCNADYLMCGLTGNPAGCTLFLDDVRCRRGASAAVAGAAGAAAAPEPSDSYEADSGLWYPAEESPPFKMFLDAAPERERERALRIEAGALGFKAVLLDRRFDIRRHPTLCLDYRAEQPLGLSLAVRVGGQWQPLAAASALGLALDGQWHSAQINLSNWLARR
ncbi:MAG: hypothetical protein HYU43_03005, partial [Armatimonadetes bacterium]|nr:hypothetical protein [Armatimonadota bacterium]